jgi:hypothetical protein
MYRREKKREWLFSCYRTSSSVFGTANGQESGAPVTSRVIATKMDLSSDRVQLQVQYGVLPDQFEGSQWLMFVHVEATGAVNFAAAACFRETNKFVQIP